jgi:hypothetical protein
LYKNILQHEAILSFFNFWVIFLITQLFRRLKKDSDNENIKTSQTQQSLLQEFPKKLSNFRQTINKIDDEDMQMLMGSGNYINNTFFNR